MQVLRPVRFAGNGFGLLFKATDPQDPRSLIQHKHLSFLAELNP